MDPTLTLATRLLVVSVGLQGVEHIVLADVEADTLQDPQTAWLQQQQPAGTQTLAGRQALGHGDG